MSAYIVSHHHIHALAIFATRKTNNSMHVNPCYLSRFSSDDKKMTGIAEVTNLYAAILHHQNARSVDHRYPAHHNNHPELPRILGRTGYILKPVEILKLCDCLEYQSCETGDYKDTSAHQLLNAIRRAAIRLLPGYDAAPWDLCDELVA